VHALVAHENDALVPIQSHYEQLKKTVLQRLKWAAGANPSLAQTLIHFEEALAVDQALLEVVYVYFFVLNSFSIRIIQVFLF